MRALFWLLACGMAAGAAEPPMPSWRGDDRKALEQGELVPGAVLLAGDEAADPADEVEPPPPAAEQVEAVATDGPEVPERFLEAYFGRRPSRFLVDPQGLLGTKDARDRESFLNYHAGDSEVDLFVYLFDGHQTIPSEVRDEELVERHFAEGKPAVVVFYYLGAPQKSDIAVSPRLSEAVSVAEQRRALVSSVEEALEKADAIAQFEAFCVQLSIRIYWMERAAGLVAEAPAVPVVRASKPAPVEAGEPPVLAGARRWAERYGVPGGIFASALGIAAGALVAARRRRRFRFPAFDVSPRLGGAHAAGIGAVISFGNTAQSPASQRNDVPDYLGL